MFKVGDIIWFYDTSVGYRQAKIKKITRTDAIIQFLDTDGGIRISVNRLFPDKESLIAFKEKNRINETPSSPPLRKKNQYDYMFENDRRA